MTYKYSISNMEPRDNPVPSVMPRGKHRVKEKCHMTSTEINTLNSDFIYIYNRNDPVNITYLLTLDTNLKGDKTGTIFSWITCVQFSFFLGLIPPRATNWCTRAILTQNYFSCHKKSQTSKSVPYLSQTNSHIIKNLKLIYLCHIYPKLNFVL